MGCAPDGGSETETSPPSRERVALELITTIGCSDCEGDEQITPTVITLLDGGGVVELDRYEPFVRRFGPDGDPEMSFGSRGQGPGELGTSTGNMYFPGIYLLPWPGGELSVLELMPAVVETFSTSGEFLHQEMLDLPLASPSAQAFAPSTGAYFRHAFVPMSDQPDVIERCVISPRQDSHCAQLATATSLIGAEPDRGRAALSIAATPQGELVIAEASTYRFWVLDASGSIVREFRRDVPPPPKSEQQLEAEREANRERRASGRAERDIYPDRPYLGRSGLQVDGAGRIWALTQRYTEEAWIFDVFANDGTYLNEVTIEALTLFDGYQVTPFVAAGDRLATIANQADGSARIDVYRVVVER